MDYQSSGGYTVQPNLGCSCGTSSNLSCQCSVQTIGIFGMLLTIALGLIIGASFPLIFLLAFPALVIFAVIMAVLVIALLLYRSCMCCRTRRC